MGNVAFTAPSVQNLCEQAFLSKLGEPTISHVERLDGALHEPGMPKYLVRSAVFPKDHMASLGPVKLIDFGQSFSAHTVPDEFHTPISARPPEVVFKDRVDESMDIWSTGCMVGDEYSAEF